MLSGTPVQANILVFEKYRQRIYMYYYSAKSLGREQWERSLRRRLRRYAIQVAFLAFPSDLPAETQSSGRRRPIVLLLRFDFRATLNLSLCPPT